MQNIIYSKLVKPKTLRDGKYAVQIYVTEENNGFFVWASDPMDIGTVLLRYHIIRSEAIEAGVDFGRMSPPEIFRAGFVGLGGINDCKPVNYEGRLEA